jgi:hypothetical protein
MNQAPSPPAQLQPEPVPRRSDTGLPDNLKSGIESLSGMSLDDVRVHYGSSQPAQLGAEAYTQGSEIHVAPGQEQHLPHEAWHVVQQAQGRVEPTVQLQNGVSANDDEGLEHEADAMGRSAAVLGNLPTSSQLPQRRTPKVREADPQQASVRGDGGKGRLPVVSPEPTASNAAVSRLVSITATGTRTIQRKPNLTEMQFNAVKDHAMKRMSGKVTALKPGGDVGEWSNGVLTNFVSEFSKTGKPISFNADDVAQLSTWMTNEYLTWWDHANFDEVMTRLAVLGGKAEYVAHLRAITDWSAGKPRIVGNPSVTTGANYDSANHLIKVSPTIRDPTEALDYITFECENARRAVSFKQAQKEGARAVAELEFQSDKAYVEGLMRVYAAANWAQLVDKLNVPASMCQTQAYDTGKRPAENVVAMPDKNQLASQAQRQALWYFKTQAWSEEQRKDVWINSKHGEGLGTSEQLYQQQLGTGTAKK